MGLDPDAEPPADTRNWGDSMGMRNLCLVGDAMSTSRPGPLVARFGDGEGDSLCFVRFVMVVAKGFEGEAWMVKAG